MASGPLCPSHGRKNELGFRPDVCRMPRGIEGTWIYSLETDGFIWYVGSTRQPYQREFQHRGEYAKGVGASQIPSEYDWSFNLLENCPDTQRYEKERYWIEKLSPLLNRKIPAKTKEDEKERQKRYRQTERAKEFGRLRAKLYRERKKMA